MTLESERPRPGGRGVASRELARVAVVGTSCSGKTALARRLSRALGTTHVELDSLHWRESWVPREPPEFRELVARAVAGERWVVDGNYSAVRELVWSRATAIVWLNYGLPRVLARALWRTVQRVVTREELYAGNRETFRRSFLSSDSILVWVLTSHARRRGEYRGLFDGGALDGISRIELRTPREAEAFLSSPPVLASRA